MQSNNNETFRILIVDDNPSIHDDYRKILAAKTSAQEEFDQLSMQLFDDELPPAYKEPIIDLDFAFQGEEAFEMVKVAYKENNPYILIFMDIRMPPGMDGIETIKKVWELHPDQEVIVCTAFTDYSWLDIQAKLNIKNRFLVLKKPFDSIEVKQLASCLIAKSRLGQQNKTVLNDLKIEKEKVESSYQKLVDETERRQFIEQQLVQAQKMEIVGTLAGGLAHDFNNVLGCIIGTLQLMQMKFQKDEIDISKDPILKGLITIEDSTNRAQSLVSHLMSISHKHDLSLDPTDLTSSIKKIVKICNNTIDKKIEINVLIDDQKLALADAAQIEQVLLNMAINAKDSMPDGGSLSFDIDTIKPSDDFLLKYPNCTGDEFQKIIIRDTGAGIAPDVINKIFDPFFTTKGLGKGTGLGLSMSFQIIQQHNGFIEVFSEQNLGTMFCIYLPICHGELDQIEESPKENEVELEEGHGTVLVIDDEEILRIVTKGILESHGYKALLASNGIEGIEIFKQHKNEITSVLLDLIMPKMNGEDCYKILMELGCDVPVLFSTGYTEDESLQRLLQHKNCSFIQKPYTLHQLIQSIQSTSVSNHSIPAEDPLAPKILVADDEEALNMAISEHLSQLGYRVQSAHSGLEAWDMYLAADNDPYDLIITDLLMPGLNGMKLSQKIRELNANIPIVIISVKTDKNIIKQAMRCNVNDFLDKPTSLSEIQDTVSRLLSNRSH
ncbi:response regulator [bacterium]|nr:response regulator [bacterium]